MMGTQQLATPGCSRFSGLCLDTVSQAAAGVGADGAFTEAMEDQLGDLMVELGYAPEQIEGLDLQSMLAELETLLKGQLSAASGADVPLQEMQGDSREAAISLAALKLFLQAGSGETDRLEQTDLTDPNAETQAALAALLQQWVAPDSAVNQDKSSAASAAAGSDQAKGVLFDQLRDLLGPGAGAADQATSPDAAATTPDSQMPLIGADVLALLKASASASRGEGQNAETANAARSFDLSQLMTPDGARQLAERLAMIAKTRDGVAELKLHPPSLGAMEVRVSVDADKTHVHFISPNPAVREVLEAAMPRLREALAQDGLALGDASVSDQRPPRDERTAGNGAGPADEELALDADADSDSAGAGESTLIGRTAAALARKLDLFA